METWGQNENCQENCQVSRLPLMEKRNLTGTERGLSAGTMDVGRGVYNPAILVHFEMYMRTGRATGAAGKGNNLAFFDDIAGLNQNFFVMGIERFIAVAVINHHHTAIALLLTRKSHDACGDGLNINAGFSCGEINTLMPGLLACERVDTAPVWR